MKPSWIAAGLVLPGLVLIALPAWAHHAFAAEFDITRPLSLAGTVTKWELVNPHSWIHLDVKGADGKVVPWDIEVGSPNSLRQWDSPPGFVRPETVCGHRQR